MDEKTAIIASTMSKIEQIVRSQLKNGDDPLLVASALMAITRYLYVESIGVDDTIKVFEAITDSFHITEDMLKKMRPTIH